MAVVGWQEVGEDVRVMVVADGGTRRWWWWRKMGEEMLHYCVPSRLA